MKEDHGIDQETVCVDYARVKRTFQGLQDKGAANSYDGRLISFYLTADSRSDIIENSG